MSASDSIVQQYEIQKKKGIKAEYDKIARSSTPPLNFQKGCPINVDSPNPTPEEIEKYFHHDFARTGQIAIVGFVYSAPIAHTWYQIMEKIVTFRSRMLAVPCKLVLDAFVFSPIAIGGYFSFRALLEGKGFEGVRSKLERKWAGALTASWCFWPAANVISFSFVPVPYRVLYNNCLSLGWNGYLSNLNSARLQDVTEERVDDPQAFTIKDGQSRSEIWTHKYAHMFCVCHHCRSKAR
eukprot:CAMPEP_0184045510 /NCGR_PEP_ID=MMETSP0956-20121227/945_1 /TAXON_ID=627963 /ORGANISM="Aplanochytrium sp, Strain PBS07" /LENGTH=237 /DNA_ID=CAMNT_0026336799 /DNA_START=345 /DNA_END=1058 /DNA_ORIENTATION=-